MNDADELARWTMNYEGPTRGVHSWCLCMKVKQVLYEADSLNFEHYQVRIARVYLKRRPG